MRFKDIRAQAKPEPEVTHYSFIMHDASGTPRAVRRALARTDRCTGRKRRKAIATVVRGAKRLGLT